MSPVDALVRTAERDGVRMLGITPAVVGAGRGVGIVATRHIKEGDVVMTIPVQAIRSLHTVPGHISCRLPADMSIHGLLAAELALDHGTPPGWASLVPTWAVFEASMPFLWPPELQALLPVEARRLLTKQHARFDKDWDMFRHGFAHKRRQHYLHAWLLVNTRSFYYETPAMMPFPWHDRLALLPVADLFNHADTGCPVSFSTESYTVTADRAYRRGDEVCTSYGEHSNDYLLAEYGFLLRENRWDTVCVDDVVIPKLSRGQRSALQENGYLGDFMLGAGSEKRDNTWVALRLLCCVDAQWQSFMDGDEDVEGTLAKATELLSDLLREFLGSFGDMPARIRELRAGNDTQKNLLGQRWEQVEAIVRKIMEPTLHVNNDGRGGFMVSNA